MTGYGLPAIASACSSNARPLQSLKRACVLPPIAPAPAKAVYVDDNGNCPCITGASRGQQSTALRSKGTRRNPYHSAK
jgi:hypothetical protein